MFHSSFGVGRSVWTLARYMTVTDTISGLVPLAATWVLMFTAATVCFVHKSGQELWVGGEREGPQKSVRGVEIRCQFASAIVRRPRVWGREMG